MMIRIGILWPHKVLVEQGKNKTDAWCMLFSSWWLNQPIWKICSSNWIICPGRDDNKKYLKPPPSLFLEPPFCAITDVKRMSWMHLLPLHLDSSWQFWQKILLPKEKSETKNLKIEVHYSLFIEKKQRSSIYLYLGHWDHILPPHPWSKRAERNTQWGQRDSQLPE